MTLFAGIFKRTNDGALPQDACDALRRVVSRDPQQERSVFADERCFFVKVDIGAYGAPGLRVDEKGAISMLAGEPLLRLDEDDDQWRSRAEDLELLHEDWLRGSQEILKRARGAFCAAHYQPERGELSLIADKLCVRPLYYWADDRYVVFATALRILESLDLVPKEMDVRAVTELVGFTFPLGPRTPYRNVSLLRAAEVVQFSACSQSHQQYWRWDDIAPSARPEEELAREAYKRFTRGVARRIGHDRATFAFLSGGLDSRSVVGALHELGLRLHTFNFSPAGSQDQIFGAEFAKKIGTVHGQAPRKDEGGPAWSQMLMDAWSAPESRQGQEEPAERPLLGWSGDGGSVGLGHVYLSREIVDLMRRGERDAAIEAYLRQERASVPVRFFKEDVAAALSDVLHRGIGEELDDIHCLDAGRSFHLFLMLNDQRRHLSRHFENIDLHHLELHLPFYDSDFLSLILSVPVELCLEHKFYSKFLVCFPPAVTSVPWQAYPGHEPCPLPVPQELGYQWSENPDAGRAATEKRRASNKQAGELLSAHDFPGKIIDKGKFRLAALFHRAGVRDLTHVIESVQTYHRYWTLCGERHHLPSSEDSANSRPAVAALTEAGMRGESIKGVEMSAGSSIECPPGLQVN